MRTRSMLVSEFACVAIVVRTAVGALQVNRLLREENNDHVVVLQDDDTAVGVLLEELGKQVRRSSAPPHSRPRLPSSSLDAPRQAALSSRSTAT
jgi:hypothetical protein